MIGSLERWPLLFKSAGLTVKMSENLGQVDSLYHPTPRHPTISRSSSCTHSVLNHILTSILLLLYS